MTHSVQNISKPVGLVARQYDVNANQDDGWQRLFEHLNRRGMSAMRR
jgi:hypothetical protein